MALILAMCGFSLAMSISPGPVNMITVSSGANYGFAKTLPFVSGATIGFTLLLLATGIGISELLQHYPSFLDYLVYAGCMFVAYMGYQLSNATGELNINKVKAPKFIEGFLLQWLNPKAWTACLAGVSAFSADGSYEMLILFSSIYFLICYVSIGLWAYVGDKIANLLHNPSYLRTFNLAMGCGLITIAVYIVIQHAY